MALAMLLLFAFSLGSLSYSRPEAFEKRNSCDLLCTCNKIAEAISGASQVYFPREHGILSFVILQTDG
jgi:hypothetical protein